jgi:hypothetical protein
MQDGVPSVPSQLKAVRRLIALLTSTAEKGVAGKKPEIIE